MVTHGAGNGRRNVQIQFDAIRKAGTNFFRSVDVRLTVATAREHGKELFLVQIDESLIVLQI